MLCQYASGLPHGILGQYIHSGASTMNEWATWSHTHNHPIEVQLMRTFVDGMCLNSFEHSNSEDVQILLQLLKHPSKRGTLSFIDNKSLNPQHVLPVYTGSFFEQL